MVFAKQSRSTRQKIQKCSDNSKAYRGRQICGKSGSRFARIKSSDISYFIIRFVALGFECYACWNVPWSEDNRCDSDGIRKVTCPRYYYRCYTMKFTMIHEGKTMHVMRRNCTSSLACDPKTPDISSKYRKNKTFCKV